MPAPTNTNNAKKGIPPPQKGGVGYVLPSVEVAAMAPQWKKYENELNALYSKGDAINQYLTPMARSIGNSEEIYPDSVNKGYDKIRNDYIARALIIDRNNDKYTDKEKEIINNSSFKGKSKEYAYNNPVKLPLSSENAGVDFIYDNEYLLKTPGIRQVLKSIVNKTTSTSHDKIGKRGFNDLEQFLYNNYNLEPSPFKPKNDYFTFMPSYSMKETSEIDDHPEKFLKRYANKETIDSIKKSPIFFKTENDPSMIQNIDGISGVYKNVPDLGKFKEGVAWDKERNLPYYFIADAYDFDPGSYSKAWGSKETYPKAYLLNKLGSPYKIYDRFYFDPKTGQYLDDSKFSNFANPSSNLKGTGEKEEAANKVKPLEWWKGYVDSPKYKERLSAFYKYPEHVQRQRSGLINSLSIRENPGTASRYYSNGNEVAISPLQIQTLKTTRGEVEAHEMAHAVNSNRDNKVASLSPQEARFILERNKNVSKSSLDRFESLSKESGKSLSRLMDGELHDVNPSENHSDINALRYLMKKRGLYDAGKENLTPEVLQKANRDDVIKRSFIMKRLKESFDDKALLEIMNKVAKNKSTDKTTIA